MTTENITQLFIDAIAQLQKDQRFLEKKKSISDSNPRKPKLTMMDSHYLQLIPSLAYNFERIVEDIEDGTEPFDTDIMLAESVTKMNGTH